MKQMESVKVGLKDEEDIVGASSESLGTAPMQATTSTSNVYLSLQKSMSNLSLNLPRDDTILNELLMPPINHISLRDLEYSEIEKNLNVMHDSYLEPTLRIKLCSGKRDPQVVAVYWDQLEDDISSLMTAVRSGKKGCVTKRLRILIEEIKIILNETYSESAEVHRQLSENYDVDLIVQELECGQFNLQAFSNLLSQLMIANCAPKRDRFINRMQMFARVGNFMNFLQDCMDLLEAMKLDLANYYIAKQKRTLLDKLVSKERKFFEDNLATKGLEIADTVEWLTLARGYITHEHMSKINTTDRPYLVYSHAIVYLALGIDESITKVPETLMFDTIRLGNMRIESQDIIITACVNAGVRKVLGNVSKEHSRKLKNQIIGILQKEKAEISEISSVAIKLIEESKREKLTQNERLNISTMIDSVIKPDSPVYKIMEARFARYLIDNLWKRKSKLSGFEGLEEEITSFANRMVALAQLNWVVHEETYTKTISEII